MSTVQARGDLDKLLVLLGDPLLVMIRAIARSSSLKFASSQFGARAWRPDDSIKRRTRRVRGARGRPAGRRATRADAIASAHHLRKFGSSAASWAA